jgi:hypothetical protein
VDHSLEEFFGWAPWVIFGVIVLVTYVATRGQVAPKPVVGQTFVCARCGQRGSRDRMVPVEHEGAVAWFCAQCALAEGSP